MPDDANADAAPRSIWCLVANVTRTPHTEGTEELRRGTKHFSPGAKVYLYPARWGDGDERAVAIGRHRGSPKLLEVVVATRRLEGFRAKEVSHPHVVGRIRD